jgi:glycosyltransferase involved in cell wall biosynthesis
VISFVVPAYNEERLLGRTLAAIHTAARELARPYELIVVDDSSTDQTVPIAEAAGARVVRVAWRQIARVRNAGARASTGDILIFVDADTLVSPPAVRATISAVDAGAVGGGAAVLPDGQLAWWVRPVFRLSNFWARQFRLAYGCYLFCTRRAFDATGGFDETLFATEEIAFSRALSRVGRVTIVRESVLTSGRKLRTHRFREYAGLLFLMLRYGTSVLRRRDQLSLWYGERRDEQ